MDELARVYDLLESPYWVIDILPRQVPANASGQYFAVEQHYLSPPQLEALRARHAALFLKLNCYVDLFVSDDAGNTWVSNPEPSSWPSLLQGHLDVAAPAEQVLIVANHDDTHLTLYNPTADLLDLVRQLAAAEGLFVWQPPEADEARSSS